MEKNKKYVELFDKIKNYLKDDLNISESLVKNILDNPYSKKSIIFWSENGQEHLSTDMMVSDILMELL